MSREMHVHVLLLSQFIWSSAASTTWIFWPTEIHGASLKRTNIYYGKQSVRFVKKKIFSCPKLVKITHKARNSYSNTVLFGLVSRHPGNPTEFHFWCFVLCFVLQPTFGQFHHAFQCFRVLMFSPTIPPMTHS